MDLKIVEDLDMRYKETCATHGMKKVMLVYPPVDLEDKVNYQNRYSIYLDQLNKDYQIYDKTEYLHLETDFITKIPASVLKFKNLKHINIWGSRFSDVTMNEIPNTVEEINISGSNLDKYMHIGLENKVNLKTFYICSHLFGFQLCKKERDYYDKSNGTIFALPDLSKLEKIVITFDYVISEQDLKPNVKDYIKNHELFTDISYRIIDIKTMFESPDRDFEVYLTPF